MHKKYFFFDYDGTIGVYGTKEVPSSTRAALKALEDNGHFVALATGRLQCNALDYIDSLGLRNIVADGGYSVTIDGELRWMQSLDVEQCKACLRKLDAEGIPWAVQTENVPVRTTPFPEFEALAGDYYLPTKVDPSITIDGLQALYKIYIPIGDRGAQSILDSGVLDGMPWVYFGYSTIFIEPLEKQIGIGKMMEELGAPLEDVVVFGDGKNDLCMFLDQWTSIAMGNAVPELKERADYVTTDCDDDGIWNACKHFGWI